MSHIRADPIFTERASIYVDNIPAFEAAAKSEMEKREDSTNGL